MSVLQERNTAGDTFAKNSSTSDKSPISKVAYKPFKIRNTDHDVHHPEYTKSRGSSPPKSALPGLKKSTRHLQPRTTVDDPKEILPPRKCSYGLRGWKLKKRTGLSTLTNEPWQEAMNSASASMDSNGMIWHVEWTPRMVEYPSAWVWKDRMAPPKKTQALRFYHPDLRPWQHRSDRLSGWSPGVPASPGDIDLMAPPPLQQQHSFNTHHHHQGSEEEEVENNKAKEGEDPTTVERNPVDTGLATYRGERHKPHACEEDVRVEGTFATNYSGPPANSWVDQCVTPAKEVSTPKSYNLSSLGSVSTFAFTEPPPSPPSLTYEQRQVCLMDANRQMASKGDFDSPSTSGRIEEAQLPRPPRSPRSLPRQYGGPASGVVPSPRRVKLCYAGLSGPSVEHAESVRPSRSAGSMVGSQTPLRDAFKEKNASTLSTAPPLSPREKASLPNGPIPNSPSTKRRLRQYLNEWIRKRKEDPFVGDRLTETQFVGTVRAALMVGCLQKSGKGDVPPPDGKRLHDLTVDEVGLWLAAHGLPRLKRRFKLAEIDGPALVKLSGKELRDELNIGTSGLRESLLQQVRANRDTLYT